jgi:cystathionine beta-synthase
MILDAIGNTPLIELNFPSLGKVLGKLEYLNPGGSIKDRSALFMVEQAEKSGVLKTGGTIVEASSGNQAIALAMIGAIKKYKVIITCSEKMSKEKLNTIKAYGAKVVVCPAVDHNNPKYYYNEAVRINKRLKGSFMPNQYYNIQNPKAHYELTGPEIWKQTSGLITHFFAAAGTSGTISGVGKFLKEKNPKIKIIAVDAANSFHATKGHPKPYKLEGIGIDFKTPCLDDSVVDEFIPVTDTQAIKMLKVMAKEYGILIGPSSGAVAYAVYNYAKKLGKKDIAVAIFADSGRAYLSKGFY